jgi:hypothetical protein
MLKIGFPRSTIGRAYVRRYSDTGQIVGGIEWANGSRTEGERDNSHMQALFARAMRDGLLIEEETW